MIEFYEAECDDCDSIIHLIKVESEDSPYFCPVCGCAGIKYEESDEEN